MLSSGKNWAILLGLPNSVRVGSGVMGLDSWWEWLVNGSMALRDARFFLMLPRDGGCCWFDRRTGGAVMERTSPGSLGPGAGSICDNGVRTRGTVEGSLERGVRKGMVGVSFLGASISMSGVPTGVGTMVTDAFSLAARPLLRT